MKVLLTTKLSCVAVVAMLSLGLPALAAENVPATSGNPPAAKAATDQRTVHLRRRAECQKLADAQALTGESLKVFMHRCLQAPSASLPPSTTATPAAQ
jgi:hypothetical protein